MTPHPDERAAIMLEHYPPDGPHHWAWALAYAAEGWRVLPLHHLDSEIVCSCRQGRECSSPGKHPRLPRWQHEATTDRDTILSWWQRWPRAGIGIATGVASGILVVDIDPRNGGSLQLAADTMGTIPTVATVATGGGGWHLYVPTTTPRPNGKPVQGVDIKGEGGLVVAPPTLHASGRRYIHKDPYHE